MWIAVSHAPDMCRAQYVQNGRRQRFGETLDDFTRLADSLSWDFPSGVAAFNVDTQKSVVCVPGQSVHAAQAHTILCWLRHMHGQAIGIAIRTVNGQLQGAFVSTDSRHEGERVERTRVVLEAIVMMMGRNANA